MGSHAWPSMAHAWSIPGGISEAQTALSIDDPPMAKKLTSEKFQFLCHAISFQFWFFVSRVSLMSRVALRTRFGTAYLEAAR